jgi:quercetin dioxygenase-like cupin family protein
MKKLLLTLFTFGLGLFMTVGVSLAQEAASTDPMVVAPDNYELRFENDRVRVMEFTIAPGGKIAMHSHPDHIAVFLTDGKIVLSYPDGTSKEMEGKVGDAAWIPAETHVGENPGTTEIKGLVIELKEPASVVAKTEEAVVAE